MSYMKQFYDFLLTHPENCWCQECDPEFYMDLDWEWEDWASL